MRTPASLLVFLALAPVALAAMLALGAGGCASGVDLSRGARRAHRAEEGTAGSTSEALATQCASGVVEGVEGIDVYDGQGTIDWAAVADAGVAFAYVKATQGTYDTQTTFKDNWVGAAAAGVARGAYHFLDPTEDGQAQASHFLSVLSGVARTDDGGDPAWGELPPMLDVECPDGDADCLYAGASGAAAPAVIAAGVWAFLRAVQAATGRRPVVYTFASYFTSNAVDAAGLDAFPLFAAYPTSDACFPLPSPWSAATLWQYSWQGQVPGIAVPVDRDRWLGSAADLARDAAAGTGSSALGDASASRSSSVAAEAGATFPADSGSLLKAEPVSAGCRIGPARGISTSFSPLWALLAGLAWRRSRLPGRGTAC
jgi:lysozyme